MRKIITTVGTSLKSNFGREKQSAEATSDALFYYLRETDVRKASAETNSLSRILKEDDSIVFLHSDTPEGELCADVLRRYYQKNKYEAIIEKVVDLRYDESVFKVKGLRSLVNKLCRLIEDAEDKGFDVIINATGGFKAEIAYATLVGLLYQKNIFYIHELFNDIIELPALPISLDIKFWQQYESDLELLSKGRPKPEVDKMGYPPEVYFLLSEEDDKYSLSPAGEAFYLAYLERKEIYKARLDEKEKLFKTTGDHSTVWKPRRIETIGDIPEEEARQLFRRIITFEFVEGVFLEDYHEFGKSQGDTRIEKISGVDGTRVKYQLRCKAGKQNFTVRVKKGYAQRLQEMLGRVAYP